MASEGCGIFTKKIRQRLSGVLGLSRRGRTITDSQFDVKNQLKNALIGVEPARVDQVLNAIIGATNC